MSVVNGSDLFMWIAGDLVAYSISYTITIDMETRPGTNKGSGIWRRPLPGMLNISGSCDGLYVFQNSYSTIANKIIERSPVRMQFGPKNLSGTVDEDIEFISGDFLITSLELNATDAENATFTASFTYYDNFGTSYGATAPTVTTTAITAILETTATSGGNVTSDGGEAVTARGVCYNISGTPTLADFTTSDGTGTGVFVSSLTGLASNSTYYVRAYATNSVGTSYGAQRTFETDEEVAPSYFWIATNGNDTTGDGEFNTPWLTLAYAITQVSASDTINIKAGTYNITSQVAIPVGISLRGQGSNTIITSTAALNPILLLSSAAQGTAGSQSISYIYFDGNNYTAVGAINVYRRSSVLIHHCDFYDFDIYGVRFYTGSGEPATHSEDNEFYNNTVYNCAGTYGENGAGLRIGGQKDILIHDNSIIRPSRGDDAGFGIKFDGTGWCEGVKIYNNTITVPIKGTSTWEFAIELWSCVGGGIEIYNNTIKGTIDFGCWVAGGDHICASDTGGYGYAVRIYNNILGQDTNGNGHVYGIDFERSFTGGLYVYNNLFQYMSLGVGTSPAAGNTCEDLYIYYNVFYNIGRIGSNQSWGCHINDSGNAVTWDNINILNNTIVASTTTTQPLDAIRIGSDDGTNYNIQNNICVGFNNRGIYFIASTIDIIALQNNNLYGNGGANAIDYTLATLTTRTENGNITTDPLFVSASNFHLQALSPARDTGLDIGLATDYEGVAVDATPNMGAYET